ncbi:MAG: hypothetical protein Q9165_002098 [Trypethelium subeluteriae]
MRLRHFTSSPDSQIRIHPLSARERAMKRQEAMEYGCRRSPSPGSHLLALVPVSTSNLLLSLSPLANYNLDTNEGTIFTPNTTATIGDSDNFLKDQFPALTLQQLAKINSLYPSNAYGEIRYICPGIYISKKYNELNIPIWNYHWDVVDPAQGEEGLGVPHTIEVNAIWGPNNTNGAAPASYNTTNAAIVPVAQGYWTSFVRAHNPNTHRFQGTPHWDQYGTNEARIHFVTNATAIETVPEDQRSRCSYLSSIGVDLQQ